MIYAVYDQTLPYPQDAQFGKGKVTSNGDYIPPTGMDFIAVDPSTLTEGIDERFYQVVSFGTLAPKPAGDIQAIKDADAQAKQDEIDKRNQRGIDLQTIKGNKGKNRSMVEINAELDRITNILEGLEP